MSAEEYRKDLVSLYMVHEYLVGRPPSTATFSDRLIAQKIGSICRNAGVYLGDYSFNWYLRGPYSSSFANALYETVRQSEEISIVAQSAKFKPKAKERLDRIRDVIDEQPSELSQGDWLELLASLLYIREHITVSLDEAISVMQVRKPRFSDPELLRFAWEVLSKL